MLEARAVKAVMVGRLGLFTLVVTDDSLIDYGSNDAFVQHVLSMDTTFSGNALRSHAITSPTIWTLGYWGIIAAEGLTGLSFAIATINMAARIRSDPQRFHHAKRFVYVGAGLGFLVWFFGFMVVAGQWFAMWQFPSWNGQEAAFRVYMPILAVLIFVNQRDA